MMTCMTATYVWKEKARHKAPVTPASCEDCGIALTTLDLNTYAFYGTLYL
jgi:hypothetical protein